MEIYTKQILFLLNILLIGYLLNILRVVFQLTANNADEGEGQEEAASYPIAGTSTIDLESMVAKTEDERTEDTELDRFLTRLHH